MTILLPWRSWIKWEALQRAPSHLLHPTTTQEEAIWPTIEGVPISTTTATPSSSLPCVGKKFKRLTQGPCRSLPPAMKSLTSLSSLDAPDQSPPCWASPIPSGPSRSPTTPPKICLEWYSSSNPLTSPPIVCQSGTRPRPCSYHDLPPPPYFSSSSLLGS